MHDDSIQNKILGFAQSKNGKLHISQIDIKADKENKETADKNVADKPSKAQSEYEQFLMDWEPGDPLPLFPPGKKLILCHFGNDSMRNGDERYIDDPELTFRPYKSGKKSLDEEFIEFKNLGPKIKEGLLSLLGRVARSRGLWIDDKNKLRCPPGTPAANQFTDITGANCFIPSPQTAAQSGARAARRALGTAEVMAAQAGQRVDTSVAGRAQAAARYSMDDLPALLEGMDIAGRIGVPKMFGARGSRATARKVPKDGTPAYLIAKREAIARGKELTAAAKELEYRFSIGASGPNAIRLPNGQLAGDVTNRQDFLEAMRQLTPNVPIEEWAEYFDNAIPGFLSMADRRKYQLAWAAYWRNQIVEMIDNQDDFKFLTKVTMNAKDNTGTTAISMVVEPFAPELGSGGRNVGVGPMGLAAQANQGGRKLIGEGGFHFTMNINQMGMFYQFMGYGRDINSDVSGFHDSIEGRAHYIATHETGHVVDFAQKLRALGIDPDVLKANGDVYGQTARVVQSQSGAIVKNPEWQSGAWKVNWSQISNPMNNPDVQKLIDAATRLQTTQYAGSRFSGRKIDLQNDLNDFYNLLTYAFFENINQTEADNNFMANVAGNKYAHENGLEARAEFYAFRRLFGELQGTRPATQTPQFGSNLQPTPSPADITAGTVVMQGNTPKDWNLLTRYVDIAAEVEVQRRREAGAYNGLPAAAVAQAEADDRRNAAAATMRRIQDLGVGTFGKNPGAWNISGRMGAINDGTQRPPSLHAQRVRNAVRSNDIRARRSANGRGTSFGISGRMGNPDPVKPERPREPDNGPFTGSFLDVLRGAATWKEFAKKYRKQDVIFFDYETTGFGDDGNMPVQIGAVKMRGGKVVERFNIFVNPGIPLGDWAKKNLKDDKGQPLTDEWLSSKASLKEAHEQLIQFFGENALLGGQFTPFDLEVLERVLKQVGLEYKPAGVIDSKAMADELLPRWTPENPDGPSMIDPKTGQRKASNSLGPLAEYLEVDLGDGWHTADADSEASAMIIEKMLDRAASRPDTPRRLLDVDQVPRIVQERRAQYEADMAEYTRKKAEYDQLISGRMGVAQFETANGSVYTRQADGKFRRRKSRMLGTTIEDTDVESTFDNTVFVNDDDAYSIMAQGQRARIIDADGDLVGRHYDDTNLDSKKFMELRRSGKDFDAAYTEAGGTVETRKIPAVRISQEPQSGLKPIEWNNKDNTFHVGSPVSSITMETSQQVSGRMGNPQRVSLAKTAQVQEVLQSTKSSVGAGMSDEYIDSWPEIEAKLNQSQVFARKPLTKAEARQRTRQRTQEIAKALLDSIGGEGRDAQQTQMSPYLAGMEIEFLAHIGEMSQDELEQEIVNAMSEFHAGLDPRPRLQVWQGDLSRILQHGYKTTHEIASDHSKSPMRQVYEAEIGLHPDIPDAIRPASGYLVHKDWLNAEDRVAAEIVERIPGADPNVNLPEFSHRGSAQENRGAVSIYGGVEIVLRPETAGRTYYGHGDSLRSRYMPVSMESVDPDEIARATLFGGMMPEKNVIDLLYGKWKGDYSSRRYDPESTQREYYEALVLGGFDAADIEQVILPTQDVIPISVLFEPDSLPVQRNRDNLGRANENSATIPAFSKMSKPQYWVDNAGVSPAEAEIITREIASNNMLSVGSNINLARLLAAEKIRKQLEAAGAKLLVRNSAAVDFFDPDSWIQGMKDKSIEEVAEARMRERIMWLIKDQLAKATS